VHAPTTLTNTANIVIVPKLVQDKVCINLLSMVAEDFSDREGSTKKIYKAIQDRLLTCESSSYVLPVMYALDSILKNNHKQQPQIFRSLVEQDAADWMPKLHKRLDVNQRLKLQKVWKTWYNETFRLFDETTWKTMGQCFTAIQVETTMTTVSGIARTVRSYVFQAGVLVLRWPWTWFVFVVITEGWLAHSNVVSAERNAKYTR
jgi:CID domain